MIDASERCNEECGDGTTTTTLLGSAIFEKGTKAVHFGKVNPVELRKGILKSV